MRNLIKIVICLLTVSASGEMFGQVFGPASLVVTYEYRNVRDTTARLSQEDFLSREKGDKTMGVGPMELWLCGESTLFFDHRYFVGDSIRTEKLHEGLRGAELNKYTVPGSQLRVIKNSSKNQLVMMDKIGLDYYRTVENTPVFDWSVHDERKEVLGYKAQKATCSFRGRDYIAWFTPEIPVSDGPWKFSGLPGLILEVYDTSYQYYYSIKGISTEPKRVELTDPIAKTCKLQDFYKLKRVDFENPAAISSAGTRFVDVNGNPIDPETLRKELKYDFQEIF